MYHDLTESKSGSVKAPVLILTTVTFLGSPPIAVRFKKSSLYWRDDESVPANTPYDPLLHTM